MSKITIKSNWEYKTYYFKKKKIDEKKDGTVILLNGEKIKYKSVKYHDSYYDMGHTYSFTGYKLIAKVPYHGYFLEVDLVELQDIKEVEEI